MQMRTLVKRLREIIVAWLTLKIALIYFCWYEHSLRKLKISSVRGLFDDCDSYKFRMCLIKIWNLKDDSDSVSTFGLKFNVRNKILTPTDLYLPTLIDFGLHLLWRPAAWTSLLRLSLLPKLSFVLSVSSDPSLPGNKIKNEIHASN